MTAMGDEEKKSSENRDVPQQDSSENRGAEGFLTVPPSPPNYISLEDLEEAAKSFTNMTLAHELAVDKDFSLEKLGDNYPISDLGNRVKEALHAAFWDVIAQELAQDPPVYSKALLLLQDIREGLKLCLLPHQTRIKERIDSVLDSDLIHRQVEENVFNFEHYSTCIIDMMSMLCAPVRDDEVKAIREMKEPIIILKSILKTIENMKLDLANFTLKQFRPHIVAESVEYEKTKFKEFLAKISPDGSSVALASLLHHTYEWLTRAMIRLKNEAKYKLDVKHIVNEAYLELLQWDEKHGYPETVRTDLSRLQAISKEMFQLCITSTIMLMTLNVGGLAVHGLQEFKSTLKTHLRANLVDVNNFTELKAVLPNISVQMSQDLRDTLAKHGYPPLPEQQNSILTAQINGICEGEDRIYKLVVKRWRDFLWEFLAVQTPSMRTPVGFSCVQEELSVSARQFYYLINHNRAVFGEYYTDLINSIMAM